VRSDWFFHMTELQSWWDSLKRLRFDQDYKFKELAYVQLSDFCAWTFDLFSSCCVDGEMVANCLYSLCGLHFHASSKSHHELF